MQSPLRRLSRWRDFPLGGFSPAKLFQSGNSGFWLEPSRLASLAQEAAGTQPVTAPGQPVGRVLDQSGGARHATQSTGAARPTYRIDGGGRPYLEFDGVDDWLATNSFDWLTDEVTIVAAIRKRSDAAEGQVAGFGLFGDPSAFALQAPGGNLANKFVAISHGGITTVAATSDAQFIAPVSAVVSMQGKISADINTLRLNGSQVAATSADQGTAASFGAKPFVIGRRNTSFYASMDLYGLVAINRTLNAQELMRAERWAAAKCGVVL